MSILRIFPLIIAVVSLQFACKKKDPENIKLSKNVYVKHHLEKSNSIRVFTKDGELKNQILIDQITSSDTSWLSHRESNTFSDTDIYAMNVVDENNAIVRGLKCTISYEVFDDQNLALFTSKDTTLLKTNGEVMDKTMQYRVAKYKPVIADEKLQSSTNGYYIFNHKTLQKNFAYIVNDELHLPYITVYQHKPIVDDLISVQNILDPNFYKHLSNNDRITIRMSEIIYKKQL